MKASAITANAQSIGAIYREFHILEMAVFGSVARASARDDSDIDIYVDFEPGYHPGLTWFDLEEKLEAIFGRPIDLSRKALLKPRVRQEALRYAVILYAA